MEETTYTPKEAAKQLGVSDQTIYNWIARGIIRADSRGILRKFHRVPASEVERMRKIGAGEIKAGNDKPRLVAA
jgi:excisionase family DNA binding protein